MRSLVVVASDPESYNLSSYSSTLNVFFPANVTDAKPILVEQCGDETSEIQHVYELARVAANAAKADAVYGLQSPFGFRAMFKSDSAKYLLSIYLKAIYDSSGSIGLKPDPRRVAPPRLACVQRNSAAVYRRLQLDYDPWIRCSQRQPSDQAPRQAFYAFGTAYIFLCPDFRNKATAPARNRCPTVAHNKFKGSVDVFYRNYQMYTLLYQLISFYLPRSASEVFNWNECVALDVKSSVRNPTNILLYIACRLHALYLYCHPLFRTGSTLMG